MIRNSLRSVKLHGISVLESDGQRSIKKKLMF